MPVGSRQSVFRVFYRDYVSGAAVSSASPESLLAERVEPLARTLLQHPDNFIGVIDQNEMILQLYRDDEETHVQAELLYPEERGMLRARMPLDQALTLLGDLPESFGEGLLPGAQFLS